MNERLVRDIASPVSSVQVRPLRQGEDVVQVGRPIIDSDLPVLSEFLKENPNVWLRVYSVPGTSIGSLNWLAGLGGVRKLWLDLLADDSFDLALLSILPDSLEALYLPSVSIKKKFDCRTLLRFTELRELSISGLIDNLSPLFQLYSLERLTLFRAKTADLKGLALHPRIESIKLHHVKMNGLDGIDEIPCLRRVRIFESVILSMERLTAARQLELLEIAVCRSQDKMSSFGAMGRLSALRLAGVSPAVELKDVLEAPILKTLCLDDFVESDMEQFAKLPDRHYSVKQAFFGFLRSDFVSAIQARLGLKLERGMERMPFGVYAEEYRR